MSKTVISVENLTKRYDLGVIGTGTLSRDLNRWWARLRGQPDPYTRIGQKDHFERIGESILALDDVSFTVQQGEALGIIGKNGAGKSTLLKILSRVTAPTSGVVKVKGRIGSLLEVGTGFHPELTGRENVYLNGAILGMRKDEVDRKFDEIVDFSGVEKFIDTPVKRYSSGMYVRLAFAVAAHLDPEILVVDEVLAVGDAEFQKKCLGKMGDVAGEGRTVLFVSHNMGAIQSLCKRVLLINNGKIEVDSATEEAVSKYIQRSLTLLDIIIENRKDRSGKGDIKFSEVKILDEKFCTTSQLRLGRPSRFIFNFIGDTNGYSDIACAFTIYDNLGREVAGFDSSNLSSLDRDSSLNKKTFICDIDELSISPGSYTVNIALRNHGVLQDHLESAIRFEVLEGYYGDRKINKNQIGRSLIKHKWFKPNNNEISKDCS